MMAARIPVNFDSTIPAVHILEIGIPLLGLNAVAGARVGAVAGAAVAILSGIAGVRALAAGRPGGVKQALTVLAAASGAIIGTLPTIAEAIGATASTAAAAVFAGANTGIALARHPRDLFSAGAATSGIVVLSTLINGGGWPLGLGLAGISAASTWLSGRRV